MKRLPKDVGVVLLTLGAVGVVIPGPVPPGIPFLVVGVVFICPGLVKRFGGGFRKRCPALHVGLTEQVKRFQSDLERRYPGSTGPR